MANYIQRKKTGQKLGMSEKIPFDTKVREMQKYIVFFQRGLEHNDS